LEGKWELWEGRSEFTKIYIKGAWRTYWRHKNENKGIAEDPFAMLCLNELSLLEEHFEPRRASQLHSLGENVVMFLLKEGHACAMNLNQLTITLGADV
jgi:hypothetical protein